MAKLYKCEMSEMNDDYVVIKTLDGSSRHWQFDSSHYINTYGTEGLESVHNRIKELEDDGYVEEERWKSDYFFESRYSSV